VFLNADVPLMYCLLRKEYLYDLQRGHGEFIPVCVFGVASIPGRAIMFHCITETGACIYRLPLNAFAWTADAPLMELETIELWDCFSHDISVIEYGYLRGLKMVAILKDRKPYDGTYLYTIDWTNSSIADNPGDGGHKCAHIIQLDNGNYAAQPNNRVQFFEPSFITNSHIWKVESRAKWHTEDSSRQFYDLVTPDKPDSHNA
jgi:hypothetical protein